MWYFPRMWVSSALGCAADSIMGDLLRPAPTWASIGTADSNFLFASMPYRIWEEPRPVRDISMPGISWRPMLAEFCIVSAAVVARMAWAASGDGFVTTYGLAQEKGLPGARIVVIPVFLILTLVACPADMCWKRVTRHLHT